MEGDVGDGAEKVERWSGFIVNVSVLHMTFLKVMF